MKSIYYGLSDGFIVRDFVFDNSGHQDDTILPDIEHKTFQIWTEQDFSVKKTERKKSFPNTADCYFRTFN